MRKTTDKYGFKIIPASILTLGENRKAMEVFELIKGDLLSYGFSPEDIETIEYAIYFKDIGLDEEVFGIQYRHEINGAMFMNNNRGRFDIPDISKVIKLIANHGLHVRFKENKDYDFDFSNYTEYALITEKDFELLEIIDFCELSALPFNMVHSSEYTAAQVEKKFINMEKLWHIKADITSYYTDYIVDKYGLHIIF